MVIQGINNTAGTLTYSAESVTIPGNSTVTISNSVLIAFAQDPNVASDIVLGNLSIGDTITIYNGTSATLFLANSALLYNQSLFSTSGKQDTGNTSLSSIDTKIPALGAAAKASSVPVTMATDQPNINVAVNSALPAGSNVIGHTIIDSGSTTAVTQSTASNLNATVIFPSAQHTIVDSGSITANAGTNLNTSALALDSTVAKDSSLTTINTSVNTLLKPASTLTAVTTLGSITSALPTGSNSIGQVTANAGTNLNTSALALEAGHLATIDSHIPAQGQTTMSASLPVVIANNQSTLNTIVPDRTNLSQTITANAQTVAISTANMGCVSAYISGSWIGTLQFEATIDGSTYVPWVGFSNAGFNWQSTIISVSQADAYLFPTYGMQTFRVRAIAWTSGTANISLATSQSFSGQVLPFTGYPGDVGAFPVTLKNSNTVLPGNTANTIPWLMKPHDGSAPLFTAAAALADGKTNPTEGRIANDVHLFNGTSWDRQRNNQDSGAALDNFTKIATAAGAAQINYNAAGAIFTIVTSAVSGTVPTLTAQLQYSYDGATTWVNIPGAVTASIIANGTATLQVYPGAVTTTNQSISWVLPRNWRFNYTIGGTTPSFTIKTYAAYVL